MKSFLVFSTLLLSTVTVAATAQAQTYQWKDSNGRTLISDTPPPKAAKPRRIINDRSAEQGENAPRAQEKAFQQRQQATQEKREKTLKEESIASQRQENCERARRSLAALESSQPVATFNERGESILLDDDSRQQERLRMQAIIDDSCR